MEFPGKQLPGFSPEDNRASHGQFSEIFHVFRHFPRQPAILPDNSRRLVNRGDYCDLQILHHTSPLKEPAPKLSEPLLFSNKKHRAKARCQNSECYVFTSVLSLASSALMAS